MPSFDIVSNVDLHELTNAVDQANRQLSNRFDFKGIDASFKLEENQVLLTAPSNFQISQMQDILYSSMTKRSIDTKSLEPHPVQTGLSAAKQVIDVKQGLEQSLAKSINQFIKSEKIKVQTQIQDQQIRVTCKKKDDLQQVISILKEQDFTQPLQFVNFRD
tara:strand:- start:1612 stop:2094 length:483 start_codon:yes stop_codon:yes gene_type:complete